MGSKPLSVVTVRDTLGVSYQAARKLKDGGGLSTDNVLKICKRYGVTAEWLVTGRGPKLAETKSATVEPPSPASDAGPFEALSAEEIEFMRNFRSLMDSEQAALMKEIAGRADALRKYIDRVTKKKPSTNGHT